MRGGVGWCLNWYCSIAGKEDMREEVMGLGDSLGGGGGVKAEGGRAREGKGRDWGHWGCDSRLGLPEGVEAASHISARDSDPPAEPACPPADPSLPHSPSAELQCCPGWRQKDQECTVRE